MCLILRRPNFGRLKTAIEGLEIAIGQKALPLLTPLAERLTEGISLLPELKTAFELDPGGMIGRLAGGQMGGMGDDAVVAAKGVDMLQAAFGDLGVTQEQALKAYRKGQKRNRLWFW